MAIINSSVVLPVEYYREVSKGIIGRSKALELGYRLPDMIGKTRTIPVAEYLPKAYWVKNMTTPVGAADEIKNKPVTEMAWKGVNLVAEEIAAIVPVSENTLKDADNLVDIAADLTEQVIGAFQQVIDATIFFGENSPWSDFNGIVSAATTAGASVTWDGQGGLSFYNAINKAMEYVETSGYLPDAILGGPSLNSAFRGTITNLGVTAGDQGQIGALPRHIDLTGGFYTSTAFAIVGDFKQLVYAFRQEIEMKLLQEATIVDPATGSVLYHLAQQDMVAFRFTLRLGVAVPNPTNRVSGVDSGDLIKANAKAFPFAVIVKSAGGSH